MTIAFYIHSLSNGGAEKVASRLSVIWNSLGHKVILLTQNPPGCKEYSHRCDAREYAPFATVTPEVAEGLKAKYGFDVLIFNDAIGDVSFPKVFASFRSIAGLKIAVIIHHTANNWMYTTGCTQELGMDGLLRQADAMVCVDKMWALWWHHRGCRSFYIENPVSIEKRVLGSKKLEKGNGEKLLVWVGRIMDWAKQPDKMVQSFVKIKAAVPDARLVMLGSKTTIAERELLKKVPAEIQSCIEMPGFIPDVTHYLEKADLHVFTSLTEVTVPQVIREAQAVGLTTIALGMPVLREVPGVILAKNEEDFAEVVTSYLKDSDTFETWRVEDDSTACEKVWARLLEALGNGTIDELAASWRPTWQNEKAYDVLLDELHRSQVCFANRYLPEYLKLRRIKMRLNIGFLVRRVIEKIGLRCRRVFTPRGAK